MHLEPDWQQLANGMRVDAQHLVVREHVGRWEPSQKPSPLCAVSKRASRLNTRSSSPSSSPLSSPLLSSARGADGGLLFSARAAGALPSAWLQSGELAC